MIILQRVIIKRCSQVVSWLFFAVLLSSCVQTAIPTTLPLSTPVLTRSTPVAYPNIASPTTEVYPSYPTSTPAAYPLPATMTPAAYPHPILTFTPTSPPAPTVIKTNEQVYSDPAGWYVVNLPNEWQVTENPNSFMGDEGIFKTGYLPEMMYMSYALDVCQWIANIGAKDTYSVALMFEHNMCKLTSLPGVMPPTVKAIIENPSADWLQRFLYIETDQTTLSKS